MTVLSLALHLLLLTGTQKVGEGSEKISPYLILLLMLGFASGLSETTASDGKMEEGPLPCTALHLCISSSQCARRNSSGGPCLNSMQLKQSLSLWSRPVTRILFHAGALLEGVAAFPHPQIVVFGKKPIPKATIQVGVLPFPSGLLERKGNHSLHPPDHGFWNQLKSC